MAEPGTKLNAIAVIQADLKTSPIGTASRLAEPLCGEPVLTRTLRRVLQARRLSATLVVCRSDQLEAVGKLVLPGVVVKTVPSLEHPALRAVRLARKWSLDSWRGGVGNTCFFDEHCHPGICSAIAEQAGAEAVVSIHPGAALIDPGMVDAMIGHYDAHIEELRIVFAPAPPGLAPAIFSRPLLAEVAKAGLSPGWVNSYRPDQPRRDMVNLPSCFRPTLAVQSTGGRLCADTQRGFRLLERLIGQVGPEAGAEEICEALCRLKDDDQALEAPHEVHVELTTAEQLGATILRPRGPAVGRRGPLPLDILERILGDLAAWDDTLLVLGGFGEPLLHPQFDEVLRLCRQAGVFGLAVRTNGIALDAERISALLDHEVDVVQVLLDADDAEGYRRVHGVDGYGAVMANLAALDEARRQRATVNPITLATLVKARETFDVLDSFYDRWVRATGWAIVEGYSHHAGLLPDRAVMSMAPPQRRPCRQLISRCTVLADGQLVACDQDFKGMWPAANLADGERLVESWRNGRMQSLRDAHGQGNYNLHPMCAECEEWHRP